MGTVLRVKNLLYMIHTRDHGFPHVTVYLGNPESHEAMAKIRLDNFIVLEAFGFDTKTLNRLVEVTIEHQKDWLEVWNDYK